MLVIALILVLAWIIPCLAAAPDSDPSTGNIVRVELEDGRSFTGQPISFRDEIVMLRTRIDGGEVERGFPRHTIARLHFSHPELVGTAIELVDDGRLPEALPHLEALWRQRAPFLALLTPDIIDLLTALPSAHLETGDAYRAIGLARTLLPHTKTDESKNRIHESILLGHYQLEFYQETEALAREWIQQQPDFPTSALGWKIMGDLALREEKFGRVVWVALQPIATAGPQPIEHLNGCYALAIHALHQQEDEGRAANLHREMMALQLAWPEDEALQTTGELYHTVTDQAAQAEPVVTEPDLDLRPPKEDLNLPIRQVRKNLRTRPP